MKNVIIDKAIKDRYCLWIDGKKLIVTALELLELRKILNDMENELEMEVRDL